MAVLPSVAAPDGFIVYSHSGDGIRACREHILSRLGIAPGGRVKPWARAVSARPAPVHDDVISAKAARARSLWAQGIDPRGTAVEIYLRSRALELPDDVAGSVLRFHTACPWREEDGSVSLVPAMLAPFRDLLTNKITGVHRTRLTTDGAKVGRKMLGVARNAVIKLDADENVTLGLTIGEGIETCLAARQLGFRPVWALGSVRAIANFQVLGGIEALTLLAETDATGANTRAIDECGLRWVEAGREVLIVDPNGGGDVNDALRRLSA